MKSLLAHVCLAVLLLFLVGCGDTGPASQCDHNLPERGVWKTPIYPGAQRVSNDEGVAQTTTFLTNETSDKVYSYYDGLLQKAGWKPDSLTEHLYGVDNCCYYGGVAVNVEAEGNGQSKVSIKTSWSMGCG